MIVADVIEKDGTSGKWLLIGDAKEGQILIKALEEYVSKNKKMVNAKKLLKQLNDTLSCF